MTLSKDGEQMVDALVKKLCRRQVAGSLQVTMETGRLLRNVLPSSRWSSVEDMEHIIHDIGLRLSEAQPIELAVHSTCQRVIHMIREEALCFQEDEPDADEQEFRDYMRTIIRQSISELLDEQESANGNIAQQALDHIHSNEIIMTIGKSSVVIQFLKEAAKVRKFQVIVAETAPFYDGQETAADLGKSGITTTVIADSAIFAFMSRVNKVILGAHVVTANGGIVAIAGSKICASAAQHHSTHVVVCAPFHALSPAYPYDTDVFNLCISPNNLHDFQIVEGDTEFQNPSFDYVGPELLSLFITNVGPHPPSYIQRLVSESHQ
ncbi:hypothetical protein EDD86DRAFT_208990 [Gorgonomyces haynaldii]|nr:hypothetical protein EDD86DRAFT_208990 [Gorgonomyces haynaldii]